MNNAKPVSHITYEEAAELAFFGAEVRIDFCKFLYLIKLIGASPNLHATCNSIWHSCSSEEFIQPFCSWNIDYFDQVYTLPSQENFPYLTFQYRDKSATLVTAITSKSHVQLIDILSTRMLGQYGFLSKVISCTYECFLSHYSAGVLCFRR